MNSNARQSTPHKRARQIHSSSAVHAGVTSNAGVHARLHDERRVCTPNAGRPRRTPGVHAERRVCTPNAAVHAILLAC
eukprot:scaffold16300_cov79-Skeletonema_dohrnii-CCMP3373.AAC.1